MLDHFRSVADVSVVYSVPTRLVSLVSLDDATSEPAHKRARLALLAEGHDDKLSERMQFRIISLRQLNRCRTVPLALGVQEKFLHEDLPITVHGSTSIGSVEVIGGPSNGRVFCEPLTLTDTTILLVS